MQDSTMALAIAGGGFLLNLGVILVHVTRRISSSDAAMSKALSKTREEIKDLINLNQREILGQMSNHQRSDDQEFATLRHEFGEMGAALRQKIVEFELWSRDNFTRK